MWPFSLIPETIDPTLRTIIIVLITVQFLAFLGYMFILIKSFKEAKKKREEEEAAAQNQSSTTKTESTTAAPAANVPTEGRESQRSSSKTKKKLD